MCYTNPRCTCVGEVAGIVQQNVIYFQHKRSVPNDRGFIMHISEPVRMFYDIKSGNFKEVPPDRAG
jgi:hypothetical protein